MMFEFTTQRQGRENARYLFVRGNKIEPNALNFTAGTAAINVAW